MITIAVGGLPTNATVRVLRSGVTVGASSQAVRLRPPGKIRFNAMGGELETTVLFPLGTDVQALDDILVLTYADQSVTHQGPYEVQDAKPVGDADMAAVRAYIIGFRL